MEKPWILNIYIAGTRLCVYFLRDFTFDVVLGGWLGWTHFKGWQNIITFFNDVPKYFLKIILTHVFFCDALFDVLVIYACKAGDNKTSDFASTSIFWLITKLKPLNKQYPITKKSQES